MNSAWTSATAVGPANTRLRSAGQRKYQMQRVSFYVTKLARLKSALFQCMHMR